MTDQSQPSSPSSSLPDVAVVIPTHERIQFLPETIRSAQAQTYRGRVEIFVVDDGSKQEVGPRLRDEFPGVHFLRRPQPGGSASARQLGSEQSTAPLIAYLDDDDLWVPDKLAIQVKFMLDHPEVDVCLTDFRKFNSEGDFAHPNSRDHNEFRSCEYRVIGDDPPALLFEPRALTPALVNGGPFSPPTTMIRREHWQRIGGWDTRIRGNGQDIEFGIRASFMGRVAFIDLPLTRARRHHGDNISGNITRTYVNVVRELAKASLDYEPELKCFMRRRLGIYFARVGWMLLRDGNHADAASHYARAMSFGCLTPTVLAKYLLAKFKSIVGPSVVAPGR